MGSPMRLPREFDQQSLLQALRELLPDLRKRYGVSTLGVFGSYARGTNREDSDLDLLVTFEEAPGLIGFLSLQNHLADLLGVRVDLVMTSALRPRIGERILAEVVPV